MRSIQELHSGEKYKAKYHKEELERELTMIKAKEYDKVDFIRRNAELEAKITYLKAEKDVFTKDKIRLESEKANSNREKLTLQV